jgi:TolB-like protein/Flp pilus assembly protein TadD
MLYGFDRFILDLRRGVLLADGAERALRPKSFALLRHLVENAERLISRDEILQAVWPGVFVTEDSITQCIREIRRALGDDTQVVLRTLPRRGYMLAIPARRQEPTDAPPPAAGVSAVQPLAAPPTDRPMVVVLPFDNIGGDPEQGYFADGLTADLVTDLTRFQDLHIVSPQRPGFRLPSRSDAPTRDLPVAARYVLGGSVRRAAGRVRVTVQLEDAQTGISLWAERFDQPLEELFAVQEDLTNRIAAFVDGQIGRESLRRARRRPPANLDAYDLYLHGRELHGRATEADSHAARQMLDRAIAADPDYAPAYAYQSYTVVRGFTLGWGEPRGRAAVDRALALAERAVALEPASSLCLMRLAFVLSLAGRSNEAVETAARGVRANPCDAAGRAGYGEALSMSGAHAAGVAELQLAQTLNPYHPPFWWGTLGRALLLAGRPHDALVELRRSVARAPDYRPGHSSMVVACVETGHMEEARAAMQDVLRLRPGWVVRDYDGVFGFNDERDTARFLAAFRAAGMPVG